jgi:hypothetical protein
LYLKSNYLSLSLVKAQKIKQTLEGHTARVGVVAWYGNNLSSGTIKFENKK